MPKDIIVVGAGGFGRETLDVIEAINAESRDVVWRVLGVADDKPTQIQIDRLAARGYEHLGTTGGVLQRLPPVAFVIGIGSPAIRCNLAAAFERESWIPATLIHPAAVIGSRAVVGEGSVICGGVQLSTSTRLGKHVHLNPGAVIGHDSYIDEFVSVNPAAVVSGQVHIGKRSLIGAGAVILQDLIVGHDALIGASACVTRNIAAHSVVKGVPAR